MIARPALVALVALLVSGLVSGCEPASGAQAKDKVRVPEGESLVMAPEATIPAHETPGRKTAIFSGGCFWGIEAVFSHVKGVSSAVSGYQGGSAANATYDKVSEGITGHAESVRVTYDPATVRYDQLLRIFFSVGADPTQYNRQGPDEGRQYRSALVPLSPEQDKVARAYLLQLGEAHLWKGAIVTTVEPNRGFYPAEAYHQDFMARNPDQDYIDYWDKPKVAGLKVMFPQFYKADFTRN